VVEVSIQDIISDLRKHIDEKFSDLQDSMKETTQKGIDNSERIAVIESRLNNGNDEFHRNNKQHEEFYAKLNVLEKQNDSQAGGVKVVQVLLVPIFIAIVVSLVKSFI